MDKYLPLGSVVLLKDSLKRVMIFGRKQIQTGTNREWDYIGCPYPEGNIDSQHVYVFNHDQIDTIFFVGLQDLEELTFREKFLKGGKR